ETGPGQVRVDLRLRGDVDRDHRVPPGGVHVRQHLVAGDAGIVDEDVDGGADGLGDLLRRIVAGGVELEGLPADLIHHRGQSLTGLGHVDADDLGAVAGEVAGDGRADPPGGSRDHCAASGQGPGGTGGHECLEVEAIAGVGGHGEELP